MSEYFWAESGRQIDPRWFENGAPVSSGWSLGAALAQMWNTSPGPESMRFARREALTGAARGDDPMIEGPFGPTDSDMLTLWRQGGTLPTDRGEPNENPANRMLSAEEANRLYGIPSHLRFTRPISEMAAVDQRDTRRAEMVRRDALARADGGMFGWTARMGAAFVGAALDPLNIASAFIPVIGPEMWAARVAEQSTRLGRAAVAARMGAVEGMAGQVMLEPANQFLAYAHQRDDDFGMAAALQNVAFGAVLGGLLHGGGRLVVDGWRGLPRMDPAVEREVHDAALRGAISQLETGRAVDVEPVFQMARSLSRNELMSSASPLAMRMGDAPEVRAAPMAAAEVAPAARADAPAARTDAPMTREEFAAYTRREDARAATEEAAQIREGLSAGRYPETVENVRPGAAPMTRADAEARVAELEARAENPEARPPDVMAAEYRAHVQEVMDQRAIADAPESTPQAVRQMIDRASSDAVRSADPEAWAAARAARSADIGGSRPRTETPVARVEAEIAALDARIADGDAVLRQAVEQGRLTEADIRLLDMTDAEARAQERGRGLEAGAACLILNGARP